MTTGQDPRKPPGRIGRWFARAPRYLYGAGLGWLLGRRFVLLPLDEAQALADTVPIVCFTVRADNTAE